MQENKKINSAFFITFNGNCKEALTLYQSCFGGSVYLETFDKPIAGISGTPVVSGSLVSEKIVVYGSDLVHNEGRRVGNFMSIYLYCNSVTERLAYIKKLVRTSNEHPEEKWIEITDAFEVRWVFGI
ncbi:hypothetical protein [Flavobacterium sp.]